ncbi:unnamed protein product [Prorocentrum cordatum]|uniref:Exostosin GT47 domain-containing protein n=1 Tax=Prorocentrum cordatum TaxID=2364126 RepID=A0ABN9SG60_9DINO|nr:unnamed protein product [Polarella glacialis]
MAGGAAVGRAAAEPQTAWKPALWAAVASLQRRPLRVHVADLGLWGPVCDEDWGYAYHLERWFRAFLLRCVPSTAAAGPEEADYVYVPHCAMNVYLARKQRRYQIMGAASASALPAHGEGDRLHEQVVRELDSDYLAGEVLPAMRRHAGVSACLARAPRCRLLLVNMAFGRDEVPLFSNGLGPEAVVITTAGAERWGRWFGGRSAPPARRGRAGCSCRAHCEPRLSLGPLDVVVPFATAHNSTSRRPGRGGRRDILALFVGSNTSCSRRELFDMWDNDDARLQGLVVSPRPLPEAAFDRLARRAVFCLVPDGHWPATMRLPAVIAKVEEQT